MIEFPFFNMQQLNLDWIIDKIKGMLSFLPDDGTVGQILRRTADGAEWSDEETNAVDSVNGMTGAVVLGADDIMMNNNESVEDSVNDLKSAIMDDLGQNYSFSDETNFATLADNYFIQDDGSVSASNGWSTYTLSCSEGDVFRVTAWAYSNKYYYAFYDNTDTFISGKKRTESGTGTDTDTITAPTDAAKIVVVGRPLTGCPAKLEKRSVHFSYVDDEVEDLADILDVNTVYYTDITTSATITDNYFIQDNGAVSAANGWSIYTLNVRVGDSYRVKALAYSNKYYYAFYNSSDTFVSGKTRNETGTGSIVEVVTAPSTAVKLVIVGRPLSGYPAIIYSPTLIQAKWSNKKWVVFGDSLTEENVRTTKHYFDYIYEKTGIKTYNMGNGGSGYALERGDGTAFYQRIGDVPLDADVITIFGSFNDLSEIGTGSGQIPLGDADDSGTTTVGGLINATLDNLFTALPLANVGVVTPTPWVNANPLTEPNAASAYVDLIIAVCKRRGIPCLDLFHCSALRPWDSDFRTLCYSKDAGNGVHPDETGHKILAPRFEAFLDMLLLH